MTLRQIFRLSRPRFWLYEVGTFSVGAAAAIAHGGGSWSWLLLVWFGYFLFPANFLIYGINDVFDYETDLRNPKKQGYEDVLRPQYHRFVLWGSLVLSAVFLWLLAFEPLQALVPFGIFLGCAIFYSAPPIRAKARPIFDALFSAGHYVATAWFAYVVAGGMGTPRVLLLAGVLWAVAMHAYSAVPDIAADTASGLRTIATLLGGPMTIVVCALLYTAAAVLATPWLGLLITLTLLLPYLILMRQSMRVVHDDALLRYYRAFPYVNAVVGAVIWWVIVLL